MNSMVYTTWHAQLAAAAAFHRTLHAGKLQCRGCVGTSPCLYDWLHSLTPCTKHTRGAWSVA